MQKYHFKNTLLYYTNYRTWIIYTLQKNILCEQIMSSWQLAYVTLTKPLDIFANSVCDIKNHKRWSDYNNSIK